MRISTWVRTLLGAGLVLVSQAGQANSYLIVELGDCQCIPVAINDHGDIAANKSGGRSQGMVYRNGKWRNLPKLSYLTAINRNGDVAGFYARAHSKGAMWLRDGTEVVVGGPKGAAYSQLSGLTNDRRAIGTYSSPEGVGCYLWAPGGHSTDIGRMDGSMDCRAAGMNESAVAGNAMLANGHFHAFQWDFNAFLDLGVLPGAEYSYASAINNKGVIVGTSGRENEGSRAFAWNGQLVDLDPAGEYHQSMATAIAPGKKGTVVGYGLPCQGCAPIAVRFTFGADNMQVIPLIAEVINAGSWTTLSFANAINGQGVIVGIGDNDKGIDQPFMLVPQDSP